MTRRVAAAVGTALTIITMVGGIFVIDDRYQKAAAAAEYRTQADIDRESGDVELRLKMLELESQMTNDPRKERIIERQTEQLMDRQNRLIELQQGH